MKSGRAQSADRLVQAKKGRIDVRTIYPDDAPITNIGVSHYDDAEARFGYETYKGGPWGLRAWVALHAARARSSRSANGALVGSATNHYISSKCMTSCRRTAPTLPTRRISTHRNISFTLLAPIQSRASFIISCSSAGTRQCRRYLRRTVPALNLPLPRSGQTTSSLPSRSTTGCSTSWPQLGKDLEDREDDDMA